MEKKRFNIIDRFYSETFVSWLDHITFPKIFLLWAIMILIFAFVYAFFPSDASRLVHAGTDDTVVEVADCIYFSFITATTTGFGDIVPLGVFKSLAILEIVLGMILIAFVTSRLVSIKQNVILDQIYDISLSDNVNRLRLSLSTFVNTLSDLTVNIQDSSPNPRVVQEINFLFLQYEDILKKIIGLSSGGKRAFKKTVNFIDNELLLYSLLNSIEKITTFLEVSKHSKKTNLKLRHSRNILQRNFSKIELFLNSFQELDGELDFENFNSRKIRVLNDFEAIIYQKKSSKKKTSSK